MSKLKTTLIAMAIIALYAVVGEMDYRAELAIAESRGAAHIARGE